MATPPAPPGAQTDAQGRLRWALACGAHVYASAGRSEAEVAATDSDHLQPAHFGVAPHEVPGWHGMSKSGLKKAMADLRYAKMRDERQRRKAARRDAAAAAAAAAAVGAPPSSRKRPRAAAGACTPPAPRAGVGSRRSWPPRRA